MIKGQDCDLIFLPASLETLLLLDDPDIRVFWPSWTGDLHMKRQGIVGHHIFDARHSLKLAFKIVPGIEPVGEARIAEGGLRDRTVAGLPVKEWGLGKIEQH